VEVPRAPFEKPSSQRTGEPSAVVRKRVEKARAFHCILKLARTIADLAGAEAIHATHVAEALQYRPRPHV